MDDTPAYVSVGGIHFEVTTLDRAVSDALDNALAHRSAHMHFANAWSIALSSDDPELRKAFQNGRNYPDGKPVVWAMKLLGRGKHLKGPERIYGPDFFERTLETGVSRCARHYFLGSTPETLEKLQANVENRFPGIAIAGVSSPPFKNFTSEDYARELAKIEASKPHIVWVGLGTPKQDMAAAYLAPLYEGIFACVGAAFDYTAGNMREAPDWMQNAGLAWLFRFAQEPRRLWRRYTFGNATFLRTVVTEIWKQARSARLRGR